MRPLFALAAAVLALAACGRQDSAPPPANETAAAPTAPAAETPKLDGQWRIAAIDGKPAEGLSASFNGGQASLSAGCVRRAFAYTQERNMVTFSASPSGSSNCEGQGASAEQATAADAMQQASIVIFSEDGSEANLSGTGGNLTLKRR